ncbi:hypothetical protein HZ326_16004 [Fusarium oxysporum f. sp. albedinis]|nr:hypothetical protein HZ326_16004 [Fusarium oxysporum f. sp. albedinis]
MGNPTKIPVHLNETDTSIKGLTGYALRNGLYHRIAVGIKTLYVNTLKIDTRISLLNSASNALRINSNVIKPESVDSAAIRLPAKVNTLNLGLGLAPGPTASIRAGSIGLVDKTVNGVVVEPKARTHYTANPRGPHISGPSLLHPLVGAQIT